MPSTLNKQQLGQVWTPDSIVQKMIGLISFKHPKLILEASSGSGNFYYPLAAKFDNVVGVEIDKSVAHKNALIKSYFDTDFHPDVIIGNPPYVAFKDIQNRPQSKLLFHKPNLFHYFLEKALSDLVSGGQLIWIVPSNIFTNTSSRLLNEIIFQNFSITHFEQVAENVWDNASVPTAIVKLIKTPNHKDKLNYFFENGKIIFGGRIATAKVEIKVGGACGFNSELVTGDTEFITSETERTQKTKFILYQPEKWIRPTPKAPQGFTYQIFVNCKTRKLQPFYILKKLKKSEFINYDASVLCIYTFGDKKDRDKLMVVLNNYDWTGAGIKKDGRFFFSQSILKAVLKAK